MTPLEQALNQMERECRAAIDLLEERLEEDPEGYAAVAQLSKAVRLLGPLRRTLPALTVRQIHDAFGAPGDYGYETPIGAALWRTYSQPREPER